MIDEFVLDACRRLLHAFSVAFRQIRWPSHNSRRPFWTSTQRAMSCRSTFQENNSLPAAQTAARANLGARKSLCIAQVEVESCYMCTIASRIYADKLNGGTSLCAMSRLSWVVTAHTMTIYIFSWRNFLLAPRRADSFNYMCVRGVFTCWVVAGQEKLHNCYQITPVFVASLKRCPRLTHKARRNRLREWIEANNGHVLILQDQASCKFSQL